MKYSNVICVAIKCWLFSLLPTSQGWDTCVYAAVLWLTSMAGLLLTYVCDNTFSFYVAAEVQSWSLRKGADNTAYHFFILLSILLKHSGKSRVILYFCEQVSP